MGDSNIIELKAELHKKQLLYKDRKKKSVNEYRQLKMKKSPDEVEKLSSETPQPEEIEDKEIFEKSKSALLRKSQLYESLNNGSSDPSQENLFLVDFSRKEISTSHYDEIDPSPNESQPNEPKMTKKPEKVFYEDILGDEMRAHGVSYYNLSRDEGERMRQLKMFDDFEKEAEAKRKEHNKKVEERQSALAERLNKIKRKKLREAGLDPELFGGVDSYEEVVVAKRDPSPETVVEQKSLEVNKEDHEVREWDVGKRNYSKTTRLDDSEFERDRKYYENKRSQRDLEFAPYY